MPSARGFHSTPLAVAGGSFTYFHRRAARGGRREPIQKIPEKKAGAAHLGEGEWERIASQEAQTGFLLPVREKGRKRRSSHCGQRSRPLSGSGWRIGRGLPGAGQSRWTSPQRGRG